LSDTGAGSEFLIWECFGFAWADFL
jgi:hypothetical protein